MVNTNNLKLIVNEMFSEQFTLDDVNKLMYTTLIKKDKENNKLEISRIGVISGFVDLNDELEVIVKFMDTIEQYTKSELSKKTTLLSEEDENE